MKKKPEIDILREELFRMMPIHSSHDWGPQSIDCRWCGCWLEYTDGSKGKPVELHDPECFAVKYLGRPKRPKQQ